MRKKYTSERQERTSFLVPLSRRFKKGKAVTETDVNNSKKKREKEKRKRTERIRNEWFCFFWGNDKKCSWQICVPRVAIEREKRRGEKKNKKRLKQFITSARPVYFPCQFFKQNKDKIKISSWFIQLHSSKRGMRNVRVVAICQYNLL